MKSSDYIFSRAGFLTQILPRILFVFLAAAALLFVSTSFDWIAVLVVGLVGGYLLILLPILTYLRALNKHREFCRTYGDSYEKLVECGAIPLNGTSILLGNSPQKYEHLLTVT